MSVGRREEMGVNARRFAERHLSPVSLADALVAIYNGEQL